VTGGLTIAAEEPLLSKGLVGAHIDACRGRVRETIEQHITPLVEDAEREARFPAEAIRRLGSDGLYRQRWAGSGDTGMALVIGEQLGATATGGIGIGISVHLESVLAILIAHQTTPELRDITDAALAGRAAGCLALSEQAGGSDITAPATQLQCDGDQFRIVGEKAFVSAGATADFALVLASDSEVGSSHALPSTTLICVPRHGYEVIGQRPALGVRSLQTVRISIDTAVPGELIVGKRGRGLIVATLGLTHERLAGAAQLIGTSKLALTLAATHLRRREQFGVQLFDHQALRLRLAALHAETSLAAGGLLALAATTPLAGPAGARAVAGAKVSIAHLAQRVIAECAHMFGGSGYLEDATPLARLWRDAMLARLGGGADEVLWELVASGLHGDEQLYRQHIGNPR
jgi:hypothetical protein